MYNSKIKYVLYPLLAGGLVIILFFSLQKPKTAKEIFPEALKKAEEILSSKSLIPNKKLGHLSFYLNDRFAIKEKSKNNIIFTDENEQGLYILFYNQNEGLHSKTNFEALKKISNTKVLETFESKNQFSFIHISKDEQQTYMLTVGIGGSKITTKTNLEDIISETTYLTETLNSLTYQIE